MTDRIYFDHSATTPLDPRVAASMDLPHGEVFGNPSSLHLEGRQARELVDRARGQVAALLNASPSEIVFTASGTEADNLALLGVFRCGYWNAPGHMITSAIEHPAILETCRFLEQNGIQVTYLPVDEYGLVDPDDLDRAFRPDTRLVSVMAPTTWSELFNRLRNLLRSPKSAEPCSILMRCSLPVRFRSM